MRKHQSEETTKRKKEEENERYPGVVSFLILKYFFMLDFNIFFYEWAVK